MEKNSAQPDGSTVHEHELARYGDRTLGLEGAMHLECLAPTVLRWLHAVGDRAHAIIEQRPVDKARPNVEDIDQLAPEPLEPPGLVGVHDKIVVVGKQSVIEVNHAADEFRRKDTNAAVVEQVDAGRLAVGVEHGVVAEMRVAVDDAVTAERMPPGGKQGGGKPIAHLKTCGLVLKQPP